MTPYILITGKFGAIFASLPAPIVAAFYCLFFGYFGTYYSFSRFSTQALLINLMIHKTCILHILTFDNTNRCCWFKFPTVLPAQQFPEPIHPRLPDFSGLVGPTILQRVHCYQRIRSHPHAWKMGTKKTNSLITVTCLFFLNARFLTTSHPCFPVQRHCQRPIFIKSICGRCAGIHLRQHSRQEGVSDQERQRQALVG